MNISFPRSSIESSEQYEQELLQDSLNSETSKSSKTIFQIVKSSLETVQYSLSNGCKAATFVCLGTSITAIATALRHMPTVSDLESHASIIKYAEDPERQIEREFANSLLQTTTWSTIGILAVVTVASAAAIFAKKKLVKKELKDPAKQV